MRVLLKFLLFIVYAVLAFVGAVALLLGSFFLAATDIPSWALGIGFAVALMTWGIILASTFASLTDWIDKHYASLRCSS